MNERVTEPARLFWGRLYHYSRIDTGKDLFGESAICFGGVCPEGGRQS